MSQINGIMGTTQKRETKSIDFVSVCVIIIIIIQNTKGKAIKQKRSKMM